MRRLTERQLLIVSLIRDKKLSDERYIELDEIIEALKAKKMVAERHSVVISVNRVIEILHESGIFIKKEPAIGRGKRQRYIIKRKKDK